MSLPYTSADFTTPRAGGGSFIEYPFIEAGDNATKVYHLKCSVNKDDYAAIALDVTMASAANAGVLSLPFTADAAAYCVGDYNHRVTDGVLMTFDRQFATIPVTRTEYEGSLIYNYPKITYSRAEVNLISKTKTIYTYYLGQSNVVLDTIFQITINGNIVNFVQDAGVLQTATVPSAYQYSLLSELVQNSSMIKYKGNIYAKKTVYIDRK